MTHKFEIKEEIEITFPHFRKYEFFLYKLLNKDMEIKVMYFPHSVKTMHSAAISYDKICEKNTFRHGSYEITEDEFNTTYQLAVKLMSIEINK